jgi:cysteine desulfurase / selenocysteine lyase
VKLYDIRKLFPIYNNQETSDIIYLDNASTTLKPISVIDKITEAYSYYPANVYRGAHRLSEKALYEYEAAREFVRRFINARSDKEIIFTKGTTEGINLIARTFGEKFIGEGDEVILTQMEHHANIVPWKMLCDRIGAVLKVVPFTPDGVLDLKVYNKMLSSKTKMVAAVHVSNSLGTVNPISTIIEQAHAYGAKVLIDAAQSISHFPIDVQDLDVDFLCFSGHKMYGPFGVGVLYGKEELLEDMPPFLGGGGMIENVSFNSISFNSLPNKFEPGTPSVSAVIGLGKAINFIHEIGFDYIKSRENHLAKYADKMLSAINGIKIFGNCPKRCPIFSFNIDGVHPHDVNTFLSQKGIAIRSGHHCTQPIMNYYKVPATNRVSLSFYNSESEIDYLEFALQQTRSFFI